MLYICEKDTDECLWGSNSETDKVARECVREESCCFQVTKDGNKEVLKIDTTADSFLSYLLKGEVGKCWYESNNTQVKAL